MIKRTFLFIFLIFICVTTLTAQKTGKYETVIIESSGQLESIVKRAAEKTIGQFSAKGFKAQNLSVTVIDLTDPGRLSAGNFRGDERVYPASVSKLFYLVALHQWLEDGKLKMSPALQRATRDMIVDSSNEATQYIVDAVTETSNGEELSGRAFEKYAAKRNVVNRYFASLNYQNIVINQKTYYEDLYGRERQFWNEGKNRNMLTTNATARLMAEIALRKAVNPARSEQMLELLKRDWESKSDDTDGQAHGFTSIALKDLNLTGAKLWSKAGWTSTTRHDVAYIETPAGMKFVICIFTTDFANERDILPHLAGSVLSKLQEAK